MWGIYELAHLILKDMESINRTEEELIKEYLELSIELQILENETKFYSDHPDNELSRQQENAVREKCKKILSDLGKFENEDKALEIRRNLLKAFSQMKAQLQNYPTKLPVSLSQGLTGDTRMTGQNYFASKIFELIKRVIYFDFTGLYRPFLDVTSDPSDSIEKSKIIEFLTMKSKN